MNFKKILPLLMVFASLLQVGAFAAETPEPAIPATEQEQTESEPIVIFLRCGEDGYEVVNLYGNSISTSDRIVENGTDECTLITEVSFNNRPHNYVMAVVRELSEAMGCTLEEAQALYEAQVMSTDIFGVVHTPELDAITSAGTDWYIRIGHMFTSIEELKPAFRKIPELQENIKLLMANGKILSNTAKSLADSSVTPEIARFANIWAQQTGENVEDLKDCAALLQGIQYLMNQLLQLIASTESMFAFILLPEGYLPGYGMVGVSSNGEIYAA